MVVIIYTYKIQINAFKFIDMPRPYMFSLEEKRVIYTGITRARKSLDYSYRGFYSEKYAV